MIKDEEEPMPLSPTSQDSTPQRIYITKSDISKGKYGITGAHGMRCNQSGAPWPARGRCRARIETEIQEREPKRLNRVCERLARDAKHVSEELDTLALCMQERKKGREEDEEMGNSRASTSNLQRQSAEDTTISHEKEACQDGKKRESDVTRNRMVRDSYRNRRGMIVNSIDDAEWLETKDGLRKEK